MKKAIFSLLAAVTVALSSGATAQTPMPLVNPTTHQTAIWNIGPGANITGALYGPSLPSGWYLLQTWTLNLGPNGIQHYLLYNPSTGRTAIWNMDINYHLMGTQWGPTMPAGFVPNA